MKRYPFVLVISLVYGLLVPILAHAFTADDILGRWLTADGDAVIEFYKCDTRYCGRIVWAKEPEKKDIHNPDPSLRNQTLLGSTIFTGFVFNGDNEWKDGRVYDPDNGKRYKCKISMDSEDRLKVRGYLLCPIFGRTTVWKRIGSTPKKLARRKGHE